MNALKVLRQDISNVISDLYDHQPNPGALLLNPTKKEFDGDLTCVVFPLVGVLKKKPVDLANEIGEKLSNKSQLVKGYNVIQGFLNLELSMEMWNLMMKDVYTWEAPPQTGKGNKLLVEFASPNTNKPLHLGHIRNILLGWSVSKIASKLGYDVVRTQIINDRGIAICKSMLAWANTAKGATPETAEMKGDHFVGHYYVEFEKMFSNEYSAWQQTEVAINIYRENSTKEEDMATFFKRYKNDYFNKFSEIGAEARAMLLRWEDGEAEIVALWDRMNSWVYEGFDKTYKDLGVEFDVLYYESETYLKGREAILEGLEKGLFYRKEDGSVWVDLENVGMDHKILLRSDGTSVYITQDIGTAMQRYEDHELDAMIYVVADEQDYHFNALFATLKKMAVPYAAQLQHLSYGMVDLPTGKMKSREGTVVDADELIVEVIEEARISAKERGGIAGLEGEEKEEIYRKIGMAALKYFIIKVNARKRMTFDPRESVDMQGTTGPYIQNAYVRIQSINRKAGDEAADIESYKDYKAELEENEKEIILLLANFNDIIIEAMEKLDPSVIANYAYALAKAYHRFYHECRILNLEDKELKAFRLSLSFAAGEILRRSMDMLGIEMPEYM